MKAAPTAAPGGRESEHIGHIDWVPRRVRDLFAALSIVSAGCTFDSTGLGSSSGPAVAFSGSDSTGETGTSDGSTGTGDASTSDNMETTSGDSGSGTAAGSSSSTTTSPGSSTTDQGPVCGNGIAEHPEECDDGNKDDTDSCLSNCQEAKCGDGAVQAGKEECDDGNGNNQDACLKNCTLATCGDGIIWNGVEKCDDGTCADGVVCLSNGKCSGTEIKCNTDYGMPNKNICSESCTIIP